MFQPSNSFGDPVAFRTIFFEEAQEHLANVEAVLLRMDTDAPHPDDLTAIFRAVHSIKGSAAMLGCTEIAALTHLQENLLDLLRKGERPIDAHDVNAMLKAGDVLRLQVQHRRNGKGDAPDAAAVEALLRERVAQPSSDAAGGQAGPVTRSFHVTLGPLGDAIDEIELDMMLSGLSDMGAVIEGDDFPQDAFSQAEGVRYLARMSALALQQATDFSDPARFPQGFHLRKVGRHTELTRVI